MFLELETNKKTIPNTCYSTAYKFKSVKFIFTFLTLFHFHFNYSKVDEKENPNSLYSNLPVDKEKGGPISNYTHKEKILINFERSVNDETTLEGFSFHEKQYIVNFPIDLVWDAYENAKPNECWSGQLTRYKNSYENSFFHNFREENHPSFIKGSVYLIRLKIFPLIKISVVFQLTKLNRSEKIIELTYGMSNTSHGKQTIHFIADGDKTIIKHSTYFKSKSDFRDKYLYSKFHEKYIDEFHAKIQKKMIDNRAVDLQKSKGHLNHLVLN